MRVRPGRWLYLVAALLLIVGVAAFVFLFKGLSSFPNNAARVAAPGDTTVTLEDAGQYAIAYEYRSVLDGKVITGPEATPAMRIAVFRADTQSEVPVTAFGSDFSYALGSTAGRMVAQFSIDQPGDYVITSQYSDGSTGPQVVFAVGPDPTDLLVPEIVVASVASLIGVATAITTLVLRMRWKRRLRTA